MQQSGRSSPRCMGACLWKELARTDVLLVRTLSLNDPVHRNENHISSFLNFTEKESGFQLPIIKKCFAIAIRPQMLKIIKEGWAQHIIEEEWQLGLILVLNVMKFTMIISIDSTYKVSFMGLELGNISTTISTTFHHTYGPASAILMARGQWIRAVQLLGCTMVWKSQWLDDPSP